METVLYRKQAVIRRENQRHDYYLRELRIQQNQLLLKTLFSGGYIKSFCDTKSSLLSI